MEHAPAARADIEGGFAFRRAQAGRSGRQVSLRAWWLSDRESQEAGPTLRLLVFARLADGGEVGPRSPFVSGTASISGCGCLGLVIQRLRHAKEAGGAERDAIGVSRS